MQKKIFDKFYKKEKLTFMHYGCLKVNNGVSDQMPNLTKGKKCQENDFL